MKIHAGMLIAALCAASLGPLSARAQTSIEKAPDPKSSTPSTKKAPGTSMKTPGDASGAPANSGIVKVPPTTGTEEMVTRPRNNVDPGMTAPTDDIDRKNQRESEEKTTRPKR
jgi:hypothetical protein